MSTKCGSAEPWSLAEALATLDGASRFGINPSLEDITAVCEALGRPQDAFTSIQVTGTNGKTSTARFTEALLRREGIHTALYTSPDLQRYPERMEIDGAVVSDDDFARAIGVASDTAAAVLGGNQLTEFELLTAAALWLFAERGAQKAVLEVGMGGRWDATSVVDPAVAVITGVGLDHTRILGDTVEKIAAEKAAIIGPGSRFVLGPGTAEVDHVFLARAGEVGATGVVVREADAASPLPEANTVRYRVAAAPSAPGGQLSLDVDGLHAGYRGLGVTAPSYQAPNAATAVAAAETALGRALDPGQAAAALEQVRLPGRFEVVSRDPLVVIDGAHNPQAASVLARAIGEAWPDPCQRPTLLLGVLSDKDARGIVEALSVVAGDIAVTRSASPRAVPAGDLAAIVAQVTGRSPEVYPSVAAALETLPRSSANGLVVTGSLTVAGEARTNIR